MRSLVFVVTLLHGFVAASPHEANVVWSELRQTGVPVADGKVERLPEPTLLDGRSSAEQQTVIARVAGQAYPLARFIRSSAVAPHVLQQRLIDQGGVRARMVDAWFVAYGELDQLGDQKLLDRVLGTDDDSDVSSSGQKLEAAALESRRIAWDATRAESEAFAHGAFTLWKRIEVESTLHTVWSRSDESVVVAAHVDRRFDDDAELPNVWRKIGGATAGQTQRGDEHSYPGLGMYLKATRLVEPAGALFVEWHLVFAEPEAWFDGANLIGSKMPAIVQSRVRALRRELAIAPR